jgi:uncharacterized protein
MKVVSNSSPLINLARIGQLNLLAHLFGRLLIPDAVWREVVEKGHGNPGADEINQAEWIERVAVSNRQLVHSLLQELDPGEAESIALAVEINADWLLMDSVLEDKPLGILV